MATACNGYVEVVDQAAPRFTNAAQCDLVMYTDNSNQSIHMGTITGAQSALTITNSNIQARLPILASNNDSSNAPAYTWSGDTNTGMYHSSAGVIGFTCAGSNTVTINTNGVAKSSLPYEIQCGYYNSGAAFGTITFTTPFSTAPVVTATVSPTSETPIYSIIVKSVTSNSFYFVKRAHNDQASAITNATDPFYWIAVVVKY
jgi:hypothetical protein